jgi:UDP-3-O-[3-hydroxymyristoyl] glucosamine N-acyltransferase
MLVREIAEALALRFEGDGNTAVTGVAPLEAAGAHQITFVGGRKAFESARGSAAGCLIVPQDFEDDWPYDDPRKSASSCVCGRCEASASATAGPAGCASDGGDR